MDKCLNCGKCCYLVNLETIRQTDIPCPYLTYTSDCKSRCRVYYRNRLGRDLGLRNKCNLRMNVHFNYDGCPYNQPNWTYIEKE